MKTPKEYIEKTVINDMSAQVQQLVISIMQEYANDRVRESGKPILSREEVVSPAIPVYSSNDGNGKHYYNNKVQ